MEISAEQFLNESVEMPELDTTFTPIPEGEYTGQIGTDEKDVDVRVGSKNDKPWMQATVQVVLSDPNLLALMKRDEPVKVRYQFFVDLHEGKMDTRPQRNVKLGALKAAVGQNKGGTWNWGMLKGQPLRVTIKQEAAKDDPETKYSRVAKVGKAQ